MAAGSEPSAEAPASSCLAIPTPLTTWIDTFNTIPSDQRNPPDDPDGAGSNNLFEFAFDGDPSSASDRGKTHALTEDATASPAGKDLALAVRQNAPVFAGSPSAESTVDGITYRIIWRRHSSVMWLALRINLKNPWVPLTHSGSSSSCAGKSHDPPAPPRDWIPPSRENRTV